jgi:hypothetical protein
VSYEIRHFPLFTSATTSFSYLFKQGFDPSKPEFFQSLLPKLSGHSAAGFSIHERRIPATLVVSNDNET